MIKIRKNYFDLCIFLSILTVFLFKFELSFIIVLLIYSFLLTSYLSRRNNYSLIIRYDNIRKFKVNEVNFMFNKSLSMSIGLSLCLAIVNLFSENYLLYNNLGICIMYFCFFFTLSNAIAIYKSNIKKTIIILIVVFILMYYISPLTLFIQMLVNNYYWLVETNIIKACLFWILIATTSGLLNYVIVKE